MRYSVALQVKLRIKAFDDSVGQTRQEGLSYRSYMINVHFPIMLHPIFLFGEHDELQENRHLLIRRIIIEERYAIEDRNDY